MNTDENIDNAGPRSNQFQAMWDNCNGEDSWMSVMGEQGALSIIDWKPGIDNLRD